jgi:hypothetical protein
MYQKSYANRCANFGDSHHNLEINIWRNLGSCLGNYEVMVTVTEIAARKRGKQGIFPLTD